MRKRKLILFAAVLALLMNISVTAADPQPYAQDSALHLHALGLLQGGADGFELDRAPTRLEGLVMLIRLLGEEKTAAGQKNASDFTDVPEWGAAYVGYAFQNGIAKGISEQEFGSEQVCTAGQYITFVLRALGYRDDQGDFDWNSSPEKAVSIGLLSQNQADTFTAAPFVRGMLADISYAALSMKLKDTSDTLADKLVAKGSFTKEAAAAEGVAPATGVTVTATPTTPAPTPEATATPAATATAAPTKKPAATPTPTPPAMQVEDGVYTLTLKEGEKVFSLLALTDGAADKDGTSVRVWEKNTLNTQKFLFKSIGDDKYKIYAVSSSNGTNRVVTVQRDTSQLDDPLAAGCSIIIRVNDDTPAQEWYIRQPVDGYCYLELAALPGYAVTCNEPTVNGGVLTMEKFTKTNQQLWRLTAVAAK